MSVMLKKEKIQTGDVVCQKYSQTTVECDVIVPDVKPDILKILEVSGYISVSEKSVRSGKVCVQGTVNMTVLYAPDGDVMSRVKSLSASQEFNHAIDVGNADADSALTLEVEPESFNYSLINSRKVSLRCVTGISAKLTRIDEFEIADGTEEADGVCTDSKKIRLCNTAVNCETGFVLREQLELPSGKPTIGEILKTTVFPQSTEFSFTDGRAVVKGQVRVCTLYTSVDDGSVQFTEHTIPFSETLEVGGAEEDMEGEIEYSVSDIYCEVRDDSDGEPRILGAEISLNALIRGLRICELDVICDAYSLDGETEICSEQRNVEQLIDNTTAGLTHKATVSIPETYPEITQICDVSASASVDRITCENGEITVFGHVTSTVLYISNDERIPLGSFTDNSEFSHTFAVPGASSDTICDAKVYVEHVSYNLGSGSSIDMRVVLGLSVRSYKTESISPITDITVIQPENEIRRPCITIYFVQSGDTLWKIAKRYKTTVDALMECNDLTSDHLSIGQQIKICR